MGATCLVRDLGDPLPPLPPNLTSPQLATAVAHPTRVRALTVLNDRVASPKELAEEIDEPLNNVAYHVEILKELGCIELVKTEPSAGGRVVEHFYRAIQRSYFDAEAWERLGQKERHAVSSTLMRLASEDINEAMAKGTFYDPDDNHISRTPMAVDELGWDEVTNALDNALKVLLRIPEAVAKRAEKAGGNVETMQIKVEIIQFRSPQPKTK
jgi:DNA-binding transcriptional ArsR family regulator